jgi:hypothetical protein
VKYSLCQGIYRLTRVGSEIQKPPTALARAITFAPTFFFDQANEVLEHVNAGFDSWSRGDCDLIAPRNVPRETNVMAKLDVR